MRGKRWRGKCNFHNSTPHLRIHFKPLSDLISSTELVLLLMAHVKFYNVLSLHRENGFFPWNFHVEIKTESRWITLLWMLPFESFHVETSFALRNFLSIRSKRLRSLTLCNQLCPRSADFASSFSSGVFQILFNLLKRHNNLQRAFLVCIEEQQNYGKITHWVETLGGS